MKKQSGFMEIRDLRLEILSRSNAQHREPCQ